jgi:hypothetical protein
MKNFTQYLLESEDKTYEFKIKIANMEVDNEVQDRIEHALDAFDVATVSKAKHLPIQDKNLDFPKFGKCDVYLINAKLKYPCTDDQIRQAIGTQGRLPLANIVVTPANQPEELMREEGAGDEKTDKKESLLQKEIEKISGGQVQVGQQKVDSMMKELSKATAKHEFAKTEKVSTKSTNDLPQNTKSVVAARKGK